ncbi:MAG TPA: SDR family oxidoreductase [Gaiellaceae bacterium]|jgi:NAD(P)-dependent dehydrogenase (short-subunit alcohol dehydrogenase family)|nr:SDR family oxidoreductase [Gaiellaceae bacterium]
MERVALISGGNRGIGREVARQLADLEYNVVIGSRDLEKGEEAARELGPAVSALQLDVTDEESIVRCVASIAEDPGRIDVLVNNAGVAGGGWSTSAIDVDLDEVRQTLETNLFGAWRLTEEALPLMRKNGYGRIVNISSGMGQLSDMGGHSPAYRVSKTGLNVLTRMLTAELADENILVNSVCPGWVRTDMGTQSARRSVEEGADTPVWLATLPDDGPRGGFFRDREPIPW